MAGQPKVSVIIPTYNERENIAELVPAISRVLSQSCLWHEIVVVDDNSPDGTAEVVRELANSYPVRLVLRPGKLGLGSAIRDGINASTGEYIVVMDADFQHPVELIPRLVEKLSEGYDIAVASRYVSGGGVKGWSFIRRTVSKGAVFLAHTFLPRTREVNDIVSGFFAVKRSVVADCNISARSMKVLVDIVCTGNWERICEVPYTFTNRKRGKSKLGFDDIVDYAKHVFSLTRRCKHYYSQPK